MNFWANGSDNELSGENEMDFNRAVGQPVLWANEVLEDSTDSDTDPVERMTENQADRDFIVNHNNYYEESDSYDEHIWEMLEMFEDGEDDWFNHWIDQNEDNFDEYIWTAAERANDRVSTKKRSRDETVAEAKFCNPPVKKVKFE